MIHPRLELVAAVAANGVIGRSGQLPWHLPDDLKHFKALTLGHPMIMGRKTFESIGRPLPGRRSIVVSRTMEAVPNGIQRAGSLEEAIQIAEHSEGAIFVAGGGVLYAAALAYARAMHLTEIDAAVEGDAFFPAWDRSQWQLVDEVRHAADASHSYPFRFSTYHRIR